MVWPGNVLVLVIPLVLAGACESRDKRAARDKPAHAATAAQPASSALPPVIVGKTGAVELLAADGAPLAVYTIAEYERERANRTGAVVARQFPDGLSKLAGAGFDLRAGASNVSWVIDGDPGRGFTFWYDENANGDLRDDTKRELTRVDGAYEATFAMTIEGMFSQPVEAPIRIRLRVDKGELRKQLAIARRGTLELPRGPMQFALVGDAGQFGLDHQFLAFDLDRDGALVFDTLDTPELFHVFEKHVTLDDRSYTFTLDLAGDTLTLQPLRDRLPPRPSLATGTPAPDFTVVDFDGKQASLSGLRGKVVLIDFWAASCAPCIKAFPRLAQLHATYNAKGLELMSIAMETEEVREVLGTHRTGIAAASDAAQERYRVDRYPMYFLIARDGTIACSRCQLDNIEQMLAGELARN